MKKFAKPAVGSIVEVTTRWKSHYYWRTSEWEDHTTRGTVLKSNYWDAPNTFKITTGITIFPEAVIPLDKVYSLKYISGGAGKMFKDESKSIQVTGSKGNTYTVTKQGNKYSCTCPGFTFRRACKHLKLIEGK